MHSKDRTLLASLGFADPDKKDPRHYLACKFLTEPEQRISLARLFPLRESNAVGPVGSAQVGQELAISKGSGQYKTTIGFVDAWFSETFGEPFESDGVRYAKLGAHAIEVKIAKCEADEVIRQIALYREHIRYPSPIDGARWILATAFALKTSDVEVLRKHHIDHVRLGPKFEAYVEAHRNEAEDESPEF